MVFRGKRKDKLSHDECDILLGDSPVPHCAETNHLGVTITQSLSWTPHVDKLLQRVSYKAHILKRLAYRCNSGNEFVAHLYLTLVRPVLEYAGPVCMPAVARIPCNSSALNCRLRVQFFEQVGSRFQTEMC